MLKSIEEALERSIYEDAVFMFMILSVIFTVPNPVYVAWSAVVIICAPFLFKKHLDEISDFNDGLIHWTINHVYNKKRNLE